MAQPGADGAILLVLGQHATKQSILSQLRQPGQLHIELDGSYDGADGLYALVKDKKRIQLLTIQRKQLTASYLEVVLQIQDCKRLETLMLQDCSCHLDVTAQLAKAAPGSLKQLGLSNDDASSLEPAAIALLSRVTGLAFGQNSFLCMLPLFRQLYELRLDEITNSTLDMILTSDLTQLQHVRCNVLRLFRPLEGTLRWASFSVFKAASIQALINLGPSDELQLVVRTRLHCGTKQQQATAHQWLTRRTVKQLQLLPLPSAHHGGSGTFLVTGAASQDMIRCIAIRLPSHSALYVDIGTIYNMPTQQILTAFARLPNTINTLCVHVDQKSVRYVAALLTQLPSHVHTVELDSADSSVRARDVEAVLHAASSRPCGVRVTTFAHQGINSARAINMEAA